jgi:hypothetical protein
LYNLWQSHSHNLKIFEHRSVRQAISSTCNIGMDHPECLPWDPRNAGLNSSVSVVGDAQREAPDEMSEDVIVDVVD